MFKFFLTNLARLNLFNVYILLKFLTLLTLLTWLTEEDLLKNCMSRGQHAYIHTHNIQHTKIATTRLNRPWGWFSEKLGIVTINITRWGTPLVTNNYCADYTLFNSLLPKPIHFTSNFLNKWSSIKKQIRMSSFICQQITTLIVDKPWLHRFCKIVIINSQNI